MADIYDQHRNAFRAVSAYVVLHNGERVATVAFKYPRDGAGRLHAYVHWLGTPMVRGHAGGGGYDKHTAAVGSAVARMLTGLHLETTDGPARQFAEALAKDTGPTWDDQLRRAGFTVLQAI